MLPLALWHPSTPTVLVSPRRSIRLFSLLQSLACTAVHEARPGEVDASVEGSRLALLSGSPVGSFTLRWSRSLFPFCLPRTLQSTLQGVHHPRDPAPAPGTRLHPSNASPSRAHRSQTHTSAHDAESVRRNTARVSPADRARPSSDVALSAHHPKLLFDARTATRPTPRMPTSHTQARSLTLVLRSPRRRRATRGAGAGLGSGSS